MEWDKLCIHVQKSQHYFLYIMLSLLVIVRNELYGRLSKFAMAIKLLLVFSPQQTLLDGGCRLSQELPQETRRVHHSDPTLSALLFHSATSPLPIVKIRFTTAKPERWAKPTAQEEKTASAHARTKGTSSRSTDVHTAAVTYSVKRKARVCISAYAPCVVYTDQESPSP